MRGFCAGCDRTIPNVFEHLHSGFLHSAERWPGAAALTVQGRSLTYFDLRQRAAAIGATMERLDAGGDMPLAAVFASRSETAFIGILGTLLAGRGYVPLNPGYPVARTRQMLQRSGARVVVAGVEAESQLIQLLEGLEPMTVLLPERGDTTLLASQDPRHTFIGTREFDLPLAWKPAAPSPDAVAYLLFTSGSTGIPKAVMVTHRNAAHFVASAVERYGIGPGDRCSQMFDTTFDLSVFDMFVGWQGGACLCCPSRATLWNPGPFIGDQQLTVWFSVPTAAAMMKRLGALQPGSYPSLRWSLFCGEGLPADTARAWAAAAPSSTVENLYGPTELTVACTVYRWHGHRSMMECEQGVVPIGEPLPGMRALVVDDDLREVPPGHAGELVVAGPQRTPGYWGDPQATARAHVAVPGHEDLFYRTGDRVRRPINGGPLRFLGRLDQQVKIAGHRVELGEVESTLLELPGVESAAAVVVPPAAEGIPEIAAFVTGRDIEPSAIRSSLRARLQDYAVPQTIRVLPALPLNPNGKVDRGALATLLTQ
jgi:amino acid adenylation domain-containing protein